MSTFDQSTLRITATLQSKFCRSIISAIAAMGVWAGLPTLAVSQQETERSSVTNNRPSPPISEEVIELPIPTDATISNAAIANFNQHGAKGYRNFGLHQYCSVYGGWQSVLCLEEYLNLDGADSEAFSELALAYLSFGRFDSSIVVLERGSRVSKKLGDILKPLLSDARKVKNCLTAARNELRIQGRDVRFPDEEVFAQAIKSADYSDTFLLLNLADAWVYAHPKSNLAQQCLADLNLSFWEDENKNTNVPELRAARAHWRGDSGLDELHRMERGAPYPAIRYMQHVLATNVSESAGVKRTWIDLPDVIWHAFRTMDENPRFTNKQKAFLFYGRVMFLLYDSGWEVGIADNLVEHLEKAVVLDPKNELYATALEAVSSNKQKINQTKLSQGRKGAEWVRKQAEALFADASEQTMSRDERAEQIVGALYRECWDFIIETAEKDDPLVADIAHKIVGCPVCWGHGYHFRSGKKCFVCGGDGDSRKETNK